jgi:hypothetical protein
MSMMHGTVMPSIQRWYACGHWDADALGDDKDHRLLTFVE